MRRRDSHGPLLAYSSWNMPEQQISKAWTIFWISTAREIREPRILCREATFARPFHLSIAIIFEKARLIKGVVKMFLEVANLNLSRYAH